jgi:hypothetical protein
MDVVIEPLKSPNDVAADAPAPSPVRPVADVPEVDVTSDATDTSGGIGTGQNSPAESDDAPSPARPVTGVPEVDAALDGLRLDGSASERLSELSSALDAVQRVLQG